jgi:hypothetical protein
LGARGGAASALGARGGAASALGARAGGAAGGFGGSGGGRPGARCAGGAGAVGAVPTPLVFETNGSGPGGLVESEGKSAGSCLAAGAGGALGRPAPLASKAAACRGGAPIAAPLAPGEGPRPGTEGNFGGLGNEAMPRTEGCLFERGELRERARSASQLCRARA